MIDAAAVVLVAMPFTPRPHPSLGLGLLKSALTRFGIAATVQYHSLRFAALIGAPLYDRIALGEYRHADLVGEWVFSAALSPQTEVDVAEYARCVLADHTSAEAVNELIALRARVDPFLDECAERVLRYRPAIVGFTSMFQQQLASLALAKRLKAGRRDLFVVFGGANCEGEMGAELVRRFDFVDAAVSGEGDIIVPRMFSAVLSGKHVDGLPGVYTRANIDRFGGGPYPNAPSVRELDALPIPDFHDFFAQIEEFGYDVSLPPRLLFETSRGCWWGEKHHCTFCGLNGATMTYRSKSSERALAELSCLIETYSTTSLGAVDNILDPRYFKDLIPALVRRGLNLDLFYEVKANLKKEQLRLLKAAGVRRIQPGVESFLTSVLTLMNKGVRGIHNVQLLKWCKELGIVPSWNLLWGFAGEDPQEYRELGRTIGRLSHLPPPVGWGQIRLDRFSPNFDDPTRHGMTNVQPYPAYRYLYDLPDGALARLAYYFTFDYLDPRDVASYTSDLTEGIEAWCRAYDSSELIAVDVEPALLIADFRPGATQRVTVLEQLDRVLYLECDGIRTVEQLHRAAVDQLGSDAEPAEIERRLQPLVDDGLMMREGNAFLSLAVPLGAYVPGGPIRERLAAVASLARDRSTMR